MDRKTYTAELASLRELRTEIAAAEKAVAAAQKALDRLTARRSRQVAGLAAYEGAQAPAVAKASGLTLAGVVRIAPLLDPTPAAVREARAGEAPAVPVAQPAPQAVPQPVAAVAPAMTRHPAPSARPAHRAETDPPPAALAHPAPGQAPGETEPGVQADLPAVVAPAPAAPPSTAPVEGPVRMLPEIPQGPAGDAFTAVTSGLVSTRPRFEQQSRVTVFLDTATGDLVVRDHTLRLALGARTPGEILDTVLDAAPGTERIYVTAGAPWHEGAERYSTLKDAVAAWLNTPSERWTTATGRGKDRLAGHFVHQRQPVGRYAPAAQPDGDMVEIRSVGEWFDPAGADPATVRDAFRLLWQELRRHWVAEHRIGAVARIDPAGQITQYRVPGDSLPSGVLEAPDGALWYIAVDQIKRIDPAGHVQGWTAGGGKGAADLGYPSAMTVGPDGAIWYDLTGSPAAVRRFDPLRGPSTVAELPEGVAPRSLVTGPDGAVWFCEHDDRDNADGIGRVTAQGHYTSRPLPPDAHPWTLAVGPDGAIWFSEAGGIGRVTTAGEVTHFPVARTEHPTSLISGPQGALWFTTETGVGRLTPAGAVTLWPVPEAESLAAIAAGPKGDLWVADSQASVLRRFRPPN